jgi:hypothetical protein
LKRKTSQIIRRADAGSAGVGHQGLDQNERADRNHHGLRSRPDFDRRWAVLGSNQ